MPGDDQKTVRYVRGTTRPSTRDVDTVPHKRSTELSSGGTSRTAPYKRKLGQRVANKGVEKARPDRGTQQELTRPAGLAEKVHAESQGQALVVGWLVVEVGIGRGQSFQLYSKRNSVGRAPGQDVALTFAQGEDNQISREAHCFVGYEPKKSVFIAEKGSGSNYTYVNGETLLNDRILKPYDRIEIGETVLVLMPFCGENFQWSLISTAEQK